MKLNLSSQFSPDERSVKAILKEYKQELIGYRPATSGIENCTLHVVTNKGNFVLRIYAFGKKSDYDIQQEINFVQYLSDNQIPVVTTIANSSGKLLTHYIKDDTSWQVIMMEQVAGTHSSQYPRSLIMQLAHTQARMYLLAQGYQKGIVKSDYQVLKESHFISLIKNRDELASSVADFIKRAESFTVVLDDSLPVGLCHLDYDNGNILSEDGRIAAVLDFDDLSNAPFVMCLAYSLWDVIMSDNPEGFNQYLNRYEEIRPLNVYEQASMMPIILFRHYVIGCMDIASGNMNTKLLNQYLNVEKKLLTLQP